VHAAYRILRQRGLVIADGRRGTRVAPRPALRTPQSAPAAREAGSGVHDLSIGLPDPALLPPLGAAMVQVDVDSVLRLDGLESTDPKLLELAAAAFRADGIPADSLGVAAGAFDAIERVLEAHLRPGDRVIIEDPVYAPIRDLLLALALVPVPVPVDERGVRPGPLEATLAKDVQAMIVVPRAQNPLGAALDAERETVLRRLLEPYRDVLLIEDDRASIVSGVPSRTLVTPASRHWAVIRSMSKVLHPDLRVALVAGDEITIARVEGRQALGPRWVSHVLQALVAELLSDPLFEHTAARARDAYTSRRRALLDALAERGIVAYGRSGLNVWIPVREEAPVVSALLDAGWLVLAGERFRIAAPPGIRITTATLDPADTPEIADTIASVEHSGRARNQY
jgi:DNA-binding transcriptional MocR family regulator